MTDVHDIAGRRRNMQAIRSKDTKPEIKLRKLLWHAGLRYRIHSKELPGKPDIVISKSRLVIFVHGCYWHRHSGCRYATNPSNNSDFWQNKFSENVTRDARQTAELILLGWKVHIVWECELKDNAENILTTIKGLL